MDPTRASPCPPGASPFPLGPHRDQNVFTVAVKHKPLPIEGDHVALSIESTGGRAVGTLMARPLPPRAGAGGGSGRSGVSRDPATRAPPQDADVRGASGGPLASPRDPEDIPGPLGLQWWGALRLTRSHSRCGARLPGGKRRLQTRTGTPRGARTARWRSHRAPRHRRSQARTWWAPAGAGSAMSGGAPTFLPDPPLASTLLCTLLLANPALSWGRSQCFCTAAGLCVTPSLSPSWGVPPSPASHASSQDRRTELGPALPGGLWTSCRGPMGGSGRPLQECPP